MNRLRSLQGQGQAVWLDFISRDILAGGELEALVAEQGVSGLTSNPAIFEQAIGGSALYDRDLAGLLGSGSAAGAAELYEELAVADIQAAADVLRPVYDATDAADGYVSLEVSPHLAADTDGTLDNARHLWQRVGRPNLMIKVPATPEGIPAIEELLAEGINVNVTLMFSLDHYEAVAAAYLRGLERTAEPRRLASVASFFVSRVDSKIDPRLDAIGNGAARELRGTIAVANSKLAYRRFQELFDGAAFARQRSRGARPQRVLWASTGTKDPAYRDVVYVEELVGPHTVNTMPPHTLAAFRDHGEARPSLLQGMEEAQARLARLAELGIDLRQVTEELQAEGVVKFVEPFDKLLSTLEVKRGALLASQPAGAEPA